MKAIENLPLSKQSFIQALFDLMEKKPIHDITIKELTKKADYDRKTFYRHFTSKEDIINLYCACILQEMAEALKERGKLTFETYILSYFEFWESHLSFLKLLEKNDILYFLEKHHDELIYQYVGRDVQPELPDELQQTSHFSKNAFYFTQGGLWNILVHWIQQEQRNSVKQLTEQLICYLEQIHLFINE